MLLLSLFIGTLAASGTWLLLRARTVPLGGIVTTTPGTTSTELSDDRRWLLVHALHAPDDAAAAAIAADIKSRYEAPLMEVFG